MTTLPVTTPLFRPFADALEYQKGRSAMTAENAWSLPAEQRPRAFWIAGLEHYSAVAEAKHFADEAVANNWTKERLADEIGKVVAANGGTILSADRLELIAHNAVAIPRMAGKWRQMTDAEFVQDRPILRYSLGPDDGHTSPICRKLQGFTARYDDPAWKGVAPPNHHKERHDVDSLTEEEAGGDVYVSPNGSEFPQIDGQTILPDPGWNFSPAEAYGADDGAFADAAAKLGAEVPAKTARDYGLPRLADLPDEAVPALPPAVEAADRAAAQAAFRETFGIQEGEKRTIVLDFSKEGVWVNDATFEDAMSESGAANFEAMLATVRDPAEVWFVPRENGHHVKRYLGVFRGPAEDETRTVLVVVERSPDGWLMKSGREKRASAIETYRRGLLTFTKAKRGAK
jgi:hypothetical protein